MSYPKDESKEKLATLKENGKVSIDELTNLLDGLLYNGRVYIKTDTGVIMDFALKVDYQTFDFVIDLRESSNVVHQGQGLFGEEIEPLN